MSDRAGISGRAANLTAAALSLIFLLAAAVFGYQSHALEKIRSSSQHYLLASLRNADGTNRRALLIPDGEYLAVALKVQPLNPGVVNAALFAEAALKPGATAPKAKIDLLAKLGWRHTPALQNRIYFAVERQDVSQIVAIADALLRRENLIDQGQALMRLMERSPPTRLQLAKSLESDPSWRLSYFQAPFPSTDRQAVGDRAKLAKMLARRGSPLSRSELSPTLRLLVDNGYSRDAYDLWIDYRDKKPELLNDSNFRWAYNLRNDENVGIPFEWMLMTGSGFWTELVEDAGAISLSINWNRRGVPVFVTQRVYLGQNPGSLTLRIDGTDLPGTLADDLSFSLICKNSVVFFDQVLIKSKTHFVLGTRDAEKCTDPQFRIAGRPYQFTSGSVSSGIEDLSIAIAGISLRPFGG